jgi:hypothetical protein
MAYRRLAGLVCTAEDTFFPGHRNLQLFSAELFSQRLIGIAFSERTAWIENFSERLGDATFGKAPTRIVCQSKSPSSPWVLCGLSPLPHPHQIAW